MKTFKVSLSKRALKHLRDIGDFIRQEFPDASDRICDELLAEIQMLKHLPARFKQVGLSRKRGYSIHLLLKDSYLIYYRIQTDDVIVLIIRHGARRPLKRFE